MSDPFEMPLRIVLVGPPADVFFGVQEGHGSEGRVVAVEKSTGEDLAFSVSVKVKGDADSESPKFSGPAVQGPAAGKFIYVNSGTYAGEAGSRWSRRAKVPLSGIGWSLIRQVRSQPAAVLEARIPGTAKDGGPVCASVRLLGEGWRVV